LIKFGTAGLWWCPGIECWWLLLKYCAVSYLPSNLLVSWLGSTDVPIPAFAAVVRIRLQ
jgi:hypothetical protein